MFIVLMESELCWCVYSVRDPKTEMVTPIVMQIVFSLSLLLCLSS